MIAKKTDKLSSDGRSQKKRPSVAGKKVAQGSRLGTVSSGSSTGTPRLVKNSHDVAKNSYDAVKNSHDVAKGSHGAVKNSHGAVKNSHEVINNSHKARSEHGVLKNSHEAGSEHAMPEAEKARESKDPSTIKRKGFSGVKRKSSSAKRKGLSRRFLIGSLVVIVLLAIGTGLLAWNQWLRYDDNADIQGTWVIDGTSQTITITDTDIVMTADVSYPYTLDTFQKTISFSFKQYNGSGSYAFSPERTTLVITETDADTGENVSTKLVKQ